MLADNMLPPVAVGVGVLVSATSWNRSETPADCAPRNHRPYCNTKDQLSWWSGVWGVTRNGDLDNHKFNSDKSGYVVVNFTIQFNSFENHVGLWN